MASHFDIGQISENKQIKKHRKKVIDSCGNNRIIPELSEIKLNIIDLGSWLGMMVFSLQWHGQFFDFRINRSQIAKIKNGAVSIYNNLFKQCVASYFSAVVYGRDEIDVARYVYNYWKNSSAWDSKFEEISKLLSAKN
jgi:hypothetical protein